MYLPKGVNRSLKVRSFAVQFTAPKVAGNRFHRKNHFKTVMVPLFFGKAFNEKEIFAIQNTAG